jgi:hypothetical protein
MKKIITLLLIIVGVIHLLPLSGVLGGDQLSSLYGLSLQESNISILMRHRAVLFGIFGIFFLYAAFNKQYQPLAFVIGSISVISFIALSWSTGNYNDAIYNVVIADIVALICLLIAVILYMITSRNN